MRKEERKYEFNLPMNLLVRSMSPGLGGNGLLLEHVVLHHLSSDQARVDLKLEHVVDCLVGLLGGRLVLPFSGLGMRTVFLLQFDKN